MTFRTKLLFISSLTVAGAVALVTGAVSVASRRAFERMDSERRQALLNQLQQELNARGTEIAHQLERLAQSSAIQQIVAGTAEYDRAEKEAKAQSLDFFDVVQPDHNILSSGHWPARFGYKNDWLPHEQDWSSRDAFFAQIREPDGGVSPALIAIRPTPGNKALVIGGRKVSADFVKSLGQAPGMRAMIQFGGEVLGTQAAAGDPEARLSLPLPRKAGIDATLIASTSLRPELELEQKILWIGVLVGSSGILIGVLMGWWTTERITRPVEKLAEGARAVASGDWSAHVDVSSRDELGELASAFNRMTMQLIEQRDRAIQAERVAAWRELARRLAHELKNPLFPLQITIENLQRAHGRSQAEFDEVFRRAPRPCSTNCST